MFKTIHLIWEERIQINKYQMILYIANENLVLSIELFICFGSFNKVKNKK